MMVAGGFLNIFRKEDSTATLGSLALLFRRLDQDLRITTFHVTFFVFCKTKNLIVINC